MGGTGQCPEHPFGVLHTVGFAEDFPVHIHHGIAPQYQIPRVSGSHGQTLAPGQLFHQPGRGIGRDGALVKIADMDFKIRRVQAQKLFPAGAAGS